MEAENFEVRRRAKGGEKRAHVPGSNGVAEFFDSIDVRPELFEAAEIAMIDMNSEQLIACVPKGHVEESRGCHPEINGGPKGWIAKSSGSPLLVDVGKRK